MRLVALILLAVSSAGCASAWPAGRPDYHVEIHVTHANGDSATGMGVLLDGQQVMTVEHVAPHDPANPIVAITVKRGGAVRVAHVSHRMGQASWERLVVLRLSRPLSLTRRPKIRYIRAGDSGSPILGRHGEVIGFVSAMGYVGAMNGAWPSVIGTIAPREPERTGP